jgi:hypothetical protein
MEKENEWFRTLPLSLFFGNPISLSLIHHQGIISPRGRDFVTSTGVAFPPEAGKRSLLDFTA